MGNAYNVEDHGATDRTTFDQYVADPAKFNDMTNKVVAISGTSAGGMGFHLAEVAIKKNAKMVICLNRDSGSAKKGEEGLKKIVEEAKSQTVVQAVNCDMQDLGVVKAAGEQVNTIAKKNGGLDVLICNAGIMATRDTRTKDGYEVQMQTNQLSHFMLTKLVWPSIELAAKNRGEARVVTHSSSARDGPPAMLREEHFAKSEAGTLGGDDTWMISELLLGRSGPWQRYHQTKLANSAFTMELHKKLQAKGITNIKAMTADPGLASSNLQVSSTQGDGLMPNWAARLLMRGSHSAEDGSLSAAMSAFSPEANSGDMYMPNKGMYGFPIKCISGGEPVKKGAEKLTCSKENQENVWKFCEKALGVTFDI